MSKWVCKICIATKGLKGSELDNWPDQGDEAAIIKHLESEHHIPVSREGETKEETAARFKRDYPESDNPATCKCPTCTWKRKAAIRA